MFKTHYYQLASKILQSYPCFACIRFYEYFADALARRIDF